jgi:hypothetical protein
LQKGWILCQEEMEQDRAARDAVAVEVWDEVRVEAEWEARLPQGPAEIVCARIAVRRSLISSDNPVINKFVPNAARK